MKKGLRPDDLADSADGIHSNLALMKKGLRRVFSDDLPWRRAFKSCPDEEGIKTVLAIGPVVTRRFKSCPDEEGMKTFDC